MNDVVMEENVRFFGQLAHSHRNHTLSWKKTREPSPVFHKNCMIGVGALVIGPVEVGENSYVASGEVLRYDLPANSVLYRGEVYPKSAFRGLII
jgi:acetyltransferase-like isoleucine patch superfamily enzyme